MTFGERFHEKCRAARFPVCLGLDPRFEDIPEAVREGAGHVRGAIARFHELAISAVADLIPAVKLQLAFYEQYGIPGLEAFRDTIAAARAAGLIVIADGKRNDIPSTAEAYARAFLGPDAFDADALTVNPYLGWDSVVPFAEEARTHGKGVFLLAHTSNPSAREYQDAVVDGEPLFLRTVRMIERLDAEFFPDGRFSSAGAIVGCTYPEAAAEIRTRASRAPVVVVGYGAQSGTLAGCLACFTDDGDGAVVNGSRSLTYALPAAESEEAVAAAVRAATERMGRDLLAGLELARKTGVAEVDPVAAHPDALA